MKIQSAGKTHIGLIRKRNEDNMCINGVYKKNHLEKEYFITDNSNTEDLNGSNIFAVCDGVGGESDGSIASLTAIKAVAESGSPGNTGNTRNTISYGSPGKKAGINQARDNHARTTYEKLEKIIENANNAVIKNSKTTMATTIALIKTDNDEAFICNVGDSRVYRFRAKKLKQLSVDDTQAQFMIDLGLISEERARKKASWHVLTQYLGVHEPGFKLAPHIAEVSMASGDIFLLCSDGLSDMVNDSELESTLNENAEKTSEEIADILIEKSLQAGGKDNVTAIVIKVEKARSTKWHQNQK